MIHIIRIQISSKARKKERPDWIHSFTGYICPLELFLLYIPAQEYSESYVLKPGVCTFFNNIFKLHVYKWVVHNIYIINLPCNYIWITKTIDLIIISSSFARFFFPQQQKVA